MKNYLLAIVLFFSNTIFADTIFSANFNFIYINSRVYILSDSFIEMNLRVVNNSAFDLTINPQGLFVLAPTTDPAANGGYIYGPTIVSNLTTINQDCSFLGTPRVFAYVDPNNCTQYNTNRTVPKGKSLHYRFKLYPSDLGPYISQGIIKTDRAFFRITCLGDSCPGENALYSQLNFTGEVVFNKISITESARGYWWGTIVPTQVITIPVKFWKNKL